MFMILKLYPSINVYELEYTVKIKNKMYVLNQLKDFIVRELLCAYVHARATYFRNCRPYSNIRH